jgi:hypothetical protein
VPLVLVESWTPLSASRDTTIDCCVGLGSRFAYTKAESHCRLDPGGKLEKLDPGGKPLSA